MKFIRHPKIGGVTEEDPDENDEEDADLPQGTR